MHSGFHWLAAAGVMLAVALLLVAVWFGARRLLRDPPEPYAPPTPATDAATKAYVDTKTGVFPCQEHSVAGRRHASDFDWRLDPSLDTARQLARNRDPAVRAIRARRFAEERGLGQ